MFLKPMLFIYNNGTKMVSISCSDKMLGFLTEKNKIFKGFGFILTGKTAHSVAKFC